jgi:hypothetical protein
LWFVVQQCFQSNLEEFNQ